MQVIHSTIDHLIQKNGFSGVTGVSASFHAGFSVAHSPDDWCNAGNNDPSEPLDGKPVASDIIRCVTLEPSTHRGGTSVTRVAPEKFNELQMETGYTRIQIDFSKLTSFIHSERQEEKNNSPNTVSCYEEPDLVLTDKLTVLTPSESVPYRHWLVHYQDSVVESVFCPPVSFAELMRFDSNANAAEPLVDLNPNMRVMSYQRPDMLKDPEMHGCDDCMNLSSMGICVAATRLGAMPGYRPVLGRRFDHRCPEWKPP